MNEYRDRFHRIENMSDSEWERYCKELRGDYLDNDDMEYELEDGDFEKTKDKLSDDFSQYKKRYSGGGINESWEVEYKERKKKGLI
jgi:hypothetical protein